MPTVRFAAVRDTDQSTLKAMADPSEKSLLGSPHHHRTTSDTDQGFDGLSSSKLVGEPVAPPRQDWKAKSHTESVKDEFGLAVA
jgi:hypothetical protein